ncbi:HTH-type transcriptional activator RhaS [Pseudovibrio axinellae]|uniref:HTH-type transcriptional activator RhaS n=1 Tax=Pseudovibrio axinellae TaxID=989403 RepID=A0A165Z1F5_9HYPH|nr:AraC family transcriptional regulator [Pseudovibrio axinellae]KZL19428.1 HTH-type transcriptional activator RhaS [Pseudovibrio axinellae]SER59567.1 transcriptional regulator, AraC family [Pseudovibrio axinellae]
MNSLAPIIQKWNLQLLPSRAYCAAYTAKQASIGFAFENQCGAHAFDSDKLVDFWTRPNSLAFVPQGCSLVSESQTGGEYLTFTVPAEYTCDIPQAERFNHAVSPRAIAAAYDLRKVILSRAEFCPLEVETRLLEVLDVTQSVMNGGFKAPAAQASMTDARLRKLLEFVEDQLASPLSVEDLAQCVDLSAGFLNRAFKAATGKTPHDFIIERRVARARQLLRAKAGTLSSIAYDCGFSSHAHMSSVFQKRLAIAPSLLIS